MATVVRLTRLGRKKRPFYRIVVTDSRKRRDGGFIETIGHYNPMVEPEVVKFDAERLASVSYTHLTLPTICSV